MSFSVPPSVVQAEKKVVKEGDNVEEYCKVTAGNPDPTVMWTKVPTSEPILENPLNIPSITRAQAGEYRCTANNTCGVDSTVVYLDVQCKSFYIKFRKKARSADQSKTFITLRATFLFGGALQ